MGEWKPMFSLVGVQWGLFQIYIMTIVFLWAYAHGNTEVETRTYTFEGANFDITPCYCNLYKGVFNITSFIHLPTYWKWNTKTYHLICTRLNLWPLLYEGLYQYYLRFTVWYFWDHHTPCIICTHLVEPEGEVISKIPLSYNTRGFLRTWHSCHSRREVSIRHPLYEYGGRIFSATYSSYLYSRCVISDITPCIYTEVCSFDTYSYKTNSQYSIRGGGAFSDISRKYEGYLRN